MCKRGPASKFTAVRSVLRADSFIREVASPDIQGKILDRAVLGVSTPAMHETSWTPWYSANDHSQYVDCTLPRHSPFKEQSCGVGVFPGNLKPVTGILRVNVTPGACLTWRILSGIQAYWLIRVHPSYVATEIAEHSNNSNCTRRFRLGLIRITTLPLTDVKSGHKVRILSEICARVALQHDWI